MHSVRDLERFLERALLVPVACYPGGDLDVRAYEDSVISGFRQDLAKCEDLESRLVQLARSQDRISVNAYRRIRREFPGLPALQRRSGWLIGLLLLAGAALTVEALMLATVGLLVTTVCLVAGVVWLLWLGWRLPPFHARVAHLSMQIRDRWQQYVDDDAIRALVRRGIRETSVLYRRITPDESLLADCNLRRNRPTTRMHHRGAPL